LLFFRNNADKILTEVKLLSAVFSASWNPGLIG